MLREVTLENIFSFKKTTVELRGLNVLIGPNAVGKAVLLEKRLPPLICIEEPEVGLHPEAIQIVAEALVDASERTQLIVTTHSEALIDALSDRPEDVLVTESDFDNGTQFERIDNH